MTRAKILAIGGGAILSVMVLGVLWHFQGNHRKSIPLPPGRSSFRQAPEFNLTDASGHEHFLAEFRGKVTLVHFWASWCPPCLAELPQILDLARGYSGRPFELVLISLDENWKDAEKVLSQTTLPPQTVSLIDPSLKVADAYGSYQFPETYLLDGRQRIVTKWVGGQNWKGPAIVSFLEELLKNAPLP